MGNTASGLLEERHAVSSSKAAKSASQITSGGAEDVDGNGWQDRRKTKNEERDKQQRIAETRDKAEKKREEKEKKDKEIQDQAEHHQEMHNKERQQKSAAAASLKQGRARSSRGIASTDVGKKRE